MILVKMFLWFRAVTFFIEHFDIRLIIRNFAAENKTIMI